MVAIMSEAELQPSVDGTKVKLSETVRCFIEVVSILRWVGDMKNKNPSVTLTTQWSYLDYTVKLP